MRIAQHMSREALQRQYSSAARGGVALFSWTHAKMAQVSQASLERAVRDVQGHRLVLLAEEEGKACRAEDLLFEAIYEKGLNISDIATLEQIGEELQLPRVEQLPLDLFKSSDCVAHNLTTCGNFASPLASLGSKLET